MMIYQGRRKPPTVIVPPSGGFGSVLDSAWTIPITSSRATSYALTNGALTFEPNEAGTGSTAARGAWGARRVAPGGSFTITAKLSTANRTTGNGRAAIFIANSATGKANTIGLIGRDSYNSLQTYFEAFGFDYSETGNWTSVNAGQNKSGIITPFPAFFWARILWDSATSQAGFYYSLDNVTWSLLSVRTLTAPDRMGICLASFDASVPADHWVTADSFVIS